MRPTVFFARADGIHLRLLYLFASTGKAYSAGISGSRMSLIKGDGPASAPRLVPIERGMEEWDATPTENRYCCYGCSDCCCYDRRPARCLDCCSTNRPAGAPQITPQLALRRQYTPKTDGTHASSVRLGNFPFISPGRLPGARWKRCVPGAGATHLGLQPTAPPVTRKTLRRGTYCTNYSKTDNEVTVKRIASTTGDGTSTYSIMVPRSTPHYPAVLISAFDPS